MVSKPGGEYKEIGQQKLNRHGPLKAVLKTGSNGILVDTCSGVKDFEASGIAPWTLLLHQPVMTTSWAADPLEPPTRTDQLVPLISLNTIVQKPGLLR